MKKFILLASLLVSFETMAQTTQWGEATGNVKFPKDNYIELANPKSPDIVQWSKIDGINVSWADTDVRYSKESVPTIKTRTKERVAGWKGEKISLMALVWSKERVENLNFEISPLKGALGSISAKAAFVRYVMQDDFSTCGFRDDIAKYNSSLSADIVDQYAKELPMDAMSVRPIWVTIELPREALAGTYTGSLSVKNGNKQLANLKIDVTVQERTLPEPKDWLFHLDFWQNPYAEARYGGFKPFSKEHLDYMRPQYERLRDAGQKVITTSIMHKPWGGQTEDYFESMITWIRLIDGTWRFDFTVFDTWVEYMMEIGIDKQIACYSMIPWDMSFKYYDQLTNSMEFIKTTTDSPEYRQMWIPLLRQLSHHLREKGWFEKTVIAMDERAPKDMMNLFQIVKEADPEFKISLAGGNHPELEGKLYEYSMASDHIFSDATFAKRKANGQITTYYTCCAQAYPNMFTYSIPAESEWIAWYAVAKKYDGYLRWAYNSYTKEPLLDARFRAFQAGDSYLVYPQRTSVRFEKLVDGIESFEKIHILIDEFTTNGNKKGIETIEKALSMFDISNFSEGISSEETVKAARALLNKL